MTFKMTPITKNKQFWTPNRQAVVRSAIVPVAIVMATMALINLIPIIDPVIVFIFGLLYLYVGKTLLILKYGDKLIEITPKSSSKKKNKVFALGNKTFTDEKLGNIAFTISLILIGSIFLAAGWPDIGNSDPIRINPTELLQFVIPFWALHLYCFITDNNLSILKAFKYGKGKQSKIIEDERNVLFKTHQDIHTKSIESMNDTSYLRTIRGTAYSLIRDD